MSFHVLRVYSKNDADFVAIVGAESPIVNKFYNISEFHTFNILVAAGVDVRLMPPLSLTAFEKKYKIKK